MSQLIVSSYPKTDTIDPKKKLDSDFTYVLLRHTFLVYKQSYIYRKSILDEFVSLLDYNSMNVQIDNLIGKS